MAKIRMIRGGGIGRSTNEDIHLFFTERFSDSVLSVIWKRRRLRSLFHRHTGCFPHHCLSSWWCKLLLCSSQTSMTQSKTNRAESVGLHQTVRVIAAASLTGGWRHTSIMRSRRCVQSGLHICLYSYLLVVNCLEYTTAFCISVENVIPFFPQNLFPTFEH